MAKSDGSFTVEIGFTGTEGVTHLRQAMDKLETLKSEYPWLTSRIEGVEDDIALAATMIGIKNEHHIDQ